MKEDGHRVSFAILGEIYISVARSRCRKRKTHETFLRLGRKSESPAFLKKGGKGSLRRGEIGGKESGGLGRRESARLRGAGGFGKRTILKKGGPHPKAPEEGISPHHLNRKNSR